MSNLLGLLHWAPLLATTIGLAYIVNAVAVGYFEHPHIVPMTHAMQAGVSPFEARFLDKKDSALATLGSMRFAVAPDRAVDNRPGPSTAP